MADIDFLSVQLYSLRELGGVDAVLDAARDAGYRNVEGIGAHLDDAAAVQQKLQARGLRMTTSHVSLAQLRDKPQAIVAACRTLGFDQLYMPSVPREQRGMPGPEWTKLGAELGQMATALHKEGVALGYHNHNWEVQIRDGETTALELLLQASAGTPLSWQVDVAWLVRGGVDPTEWLARYAGRITSVHVKDLAPTGENLDEDGWAAVGSGVLDWPALWQAAQRAGAKWMVVEHDKPRDPAASIRASRDYIAGMAA
jgi:sugar phosphate isomerase/epimerase